MKSSKKPIGKAKYRTLNHNVSMEKLRYMLINLYVLNSMKELSNYFTPNVLLHLDIVHSKRNACGVCGSWFLQYPIFRLQKISLD